MGYRYPAINQVGPLLETEWHQYSPFNNLCPNQYPAGSDVIAVAQIMKYYAHPDTGVVFKNYKIELFPKIRETVIKLHSTIPWLKFCNWDITLDYNGNPVVIETEKPVGIDPQLSLGKSCFGDYTEEILTFLKNNDRR